MGFTHGVQKPLNCMRNFLSCAFFRVLVSFSEALLSTPHRPNPRITSAFIRGDHRMVYNAVIKNRVRWLHIYTDLEGPSIHGERHESKLQSDVHRMVWKARQEQGWPVLFAATFPAPGTRAWHRWGAHYVLPESMNTCVKEPDPLHVGDV